MGAVRRGVLGFFRFPSVPFGVLGILGILLGTIGARLRLLDGLGHAETPSPPGMVRRPAGVGRAAGEAGVAPTGWWRRRSEWVGLRATQASPLRWGAALGGGQGAALAVEVDEGLVRAQFAGRVGRLALNVGA